MVAVTDGVFVYDGPMWAGREDNLGTTVRLRQGGVEVVVISLPQQPIDLALCRSLGIDCASKRYVCVKSTGHFRSGFEAIAVRATTSCSLCPSVCACLTTLCLQGSIFNVVGGAILPSEWSEMGFTRLGRRMYPLDPGASYEAVARL